MYGTPLVSQLINNFFHCLQSQVLCEGGMGLAAREGVTATLVCSLLLLFCASRPVDCQRRDLQRVIPPPLVSLLLLLQVIQQLRSSPRYRPTRRPAGHQVTILTQQTSSFVGCAWLRVFLLRLIEYNIVEIKERRIVGFMSPCKKHS